MICEASEALHGVGIGLICASNWQKFGAHFHSNYRRKCHSIHLIFLPSKYHVGGQQKKQNLEGTPY
jgi:hypothetical protein